MTKFLTLASAAVVVAALIVPSLAISALPSVRAKGHTGSGCGPADAKFDVKTEKRPRALPAPPAGKALVVFLQDDSKFGSRPRPTTRFGVDSVWVGATHANSYFFAFVGPGKHDVCANWQSFVIIGPKRSTAATQFTAAAGKTYYFRAQDIAIFNHPGGSLLFEPEVRLSPLAGDEARVLIDSFAFSVFKARKK